MPQEHDNGRMVEISEADCLDIESNFATPTRYLVGRIRAGVIAARPPEPRMVTFGGETYLRIGTGEWETGRELCGSPVELHGPFAEAIERIWQLENPEATPIAGELTAEDIQWLICAVNLLTGMHYADTIEGGPEAFTGMQTALSHLSTIATEATP